MTADSTSSSGDTFVGACSDCGKKLKLPARMQGKSVQCKSCRSGSPSTKAASGAATRTGASRPASRLKPVGDEVSPDALLGDFQGQKLLLVALIAVVVHVVLIFGSSLGYLKDEVFGVDTSEMDKDERVKVAIGEATSALGAIAKRHNLSVEDITRKFAGGGSRASKIGESKKPEVKPGTTPPADAKEAAEKRDPSALEKSLPTATKGPETPEAGDADDMTGL